MGRPCKFDESFPKSGKEMPAVIDALVKRGIRLCILTKLHSLASPCECSKLFRQRPPPSV